MSRMPSRRRVLSTGASLASATAFLSVADVSEAVDTPAAPTQQRPDVGAPQSTGTDEAGDPDAFDREAVEQLVHEVVNDVRADHGLDPVTFENDLREIARYHSRDMAEDDYFGHTSPEGEALEDRFAQFDLECWWFSENIVRTYYDTPMRTSCGIEEYTTPDELARGIVNQWMNSDSHRDNLLQPQWKTEGIGIYGDDSGGETEVHATQNFCSES